MALISLLPTYNPIALLRQGGFLQSNNFSLSETPPLTDKVAVVTGGAAGLGREITGQLLLHDIGKVFIVSRSAKRLEQAQEFWKEKHGINPDDSSKRVEFVECDLSDIRSVKKAAEEILAKATRLDFLFCNAGKYSHF